MKLLPILFITDEGSVHNFLQVVGTGTKEYLFKHEPDFEFQRLGRTYRGAHVRRYESMEAFDAEQFNLIGHSKRWPIYFAVTTDEQHDMEFLLQIDDLQKERDLLKSRVGFLETAAEQDAELLRQARATIQETEARIPKRVVEQEPPAGGVGAGSQVQEPDPNELPKGAVYGGDDAAGAGGDASGEGDEREEETGGGLDLPPPARRSRRRGRLQAQAARRQGEAVNRF